MATPGRDVDRAVGRHRSAIGIAPRRQALPDRSGRECDDRERVGEVLRYIEEAVVGGEGQSRRVSGAILPLGVGCE